MLSLHAALSIFKAWNTGHPGGIATIHANGAVAALYRLEQLIQEAVVTVPRRLIAEAIDLIVFISGRGLARRVETVARVAGLDPDGGYGVVEIPSDHPKTGDCTMSANTNSRRGMPNITAAALAAGLLFAATAHADDQGMASEEPVHTVLESVQRTVAPLFTSTIIK